jgi:hypothetical protein
MICFVLLSSSCSFLSLHPLLTTDKPLRFTLNFNLSKVVHVFIPFCYPGVAFIPRVWLDMNDWNGTRVFTFHVHKTKSLELAFLLYSCHYI